MLNNVKAGIIGLDVLGRAYAGILKDHIKNLELIGGSAKSQKNLLFAKNDLSLQYVYSDELKLIENHDIDAIFLFCPPEQKSFLACEAIKAGKNVFIGSPIATNVEDSEVLLKTSKGRPSQVTMAGFAHRLDPRLLKVKSLLDAKTIGSIRSIEISSTFTHGLYSKYLKSAGSEFIDFGLNEIDIFLWLIQEPVYTIQSVHNKGENHVICTTQNAKIINIVVSSHNKRLQSQIKITGEKGIIHFDNLSKDFIYVMDGDDEVYKTFIIDSDVPRNNDYLHLKHFVDVVLTNQKNNLVLDSNVEALKVAIAMEKSKVLDRPVNLVEK